VVRKSAALGCPFVATYDALRTSDQSKTSDPCHSAASRDRPLHDGVPTREFIPLQPAEASVALRTVAGIPARRTGGEAGGPAPVLRVAR
jgi:hypothetical protein